MIGRLVLVSMMGLAIACDAAGVRPESRFDGERAFADLRAQVAIGPRPSGSDGAEQTRALITGRLRQAGWPVRRHEFTVQGPEDAPVEMVNLIAELPGTREGWIVFGAHYDTKRLDDVRFVGANDGASGVAVLLELARRVGPLERGYGVRLVFFDGEEAFGPDLTSEDGIYGSRALAQEWSEAGDLDRIRALIVVDMVADRDLDLVNDRSSSPRLRALAREAAGSLGIEESVLGGPELAMVDDHLPFRERGLTEVLCLIDFRYGDRTVPGPLWHTPGDRLDAVSVESLNTVGELVVELYERLAIGHGGATGAP